jgi:hypothetical protein
LSGFVLAARSDDGGVEVPDGLGEVAAGVVLVADHCFAAVAVAAFEQRESDQVAVYAPGDTDKPVANSAPFKFTYTL